MKQLTHVLIALMAIWLFSCASEQTGTEGQESATTTQTEEAPSTAFEVTVTDPEAPSPRKMLKGTIGDIGVTIDYSSPAVKERTIWGDLVPYGEVWRTGANQATTIEFSKDVVISGQELPQGKYAFFTIPFEGNWTLIFNRTANQFGAFNYDEKEDVTRVAVKPQPVAESTENMEFMLDGNKVVLAWEKLKVAFPVE
ncbi:MAG: DUF2911 domain-containing protein [Bacteroidota bacterium]